MTFFRTDKPLMPSWGLLPQSFELLRQNIWQVIYLSFLPALILSVGTVMLSTLDTEAILSGTATLEGRHVAGFIIVTIAMLLSALTHPAFLYMQAQAVRGHEASISESFRKGLGRLLPLVIATLLSLILVSLGMLAFVIPGLFMLRGFYLAPYYVVDKKLGPIQALKQSYKDSVPASGWIWGVISVTFFLAFVALILGAIPVLGYLLSLAIGYPYIFARALRYGEIALDIPVPNKQDD